ncbi:GNAT family N-acetyltransferase [Sodalis sp. dw_96]|uniref:GNAT family N-acetyltransferase n=1 Tax=Sodalis sp. dw_96 TaxID=2719794 RepID=UPI001BD34EEC|nr:GNAT family N-acetyltransferase [Sodalis sp. dw_96]
MNVMWYDWHHYELTVQRLYDILALRNAVFIVEQTCFYQDIDGQDLLGDNRHVAGYLEGKLVAYARILTDKDILTIGRVIVSPRARGIKLGNLLMEQAMEACAARWPGRKIHLSAQAHLQKFYGRFGFHAVTEVYEEDGIPHIGMDNDPSSVR